MHGMTEFRDYLFGLTIASPLVVLVRGLDKVWNPRKADIARKGKSGEFQSLPKLQWMEEILHQLMGGLSHYLCGFNPPRWCRISSIHSIIEISQRTKGIYGDLMGIAWRYHWRF
jgi:hypothetical protein